ncbi:patatin family protein [Micrococcus sp.]|uniref:patatin-like phospholipase family protein n=1 Tax=Micrococcus sp. TaxID=1271 RepID=UPI002A90DA4C|nr:patatin family protein [Micrococcus sp.]MDY6054598.1 patatin family protein [Micrococcus sp.]
MEQTLTSTVTDTALLFEGGGMRASLTSAVVAELLRERIHMDFVAGVSAGASNTVNYVARDPERARRSFVDFAEDPRFGDWRTFLRGKGLFNAEYIYEHAGLPEADLPFDFATFQANPAAVVLAGFDARTGRTRWWTREDMQTLPELMVRVRASSTMPLLMPPVHAEGTVYVDGALGVDGGIPVTAAEDAGYERMLVVMTRERSYVKAPERFPSVYQHLFRRHPAVAEALLTRWRRYNATRERLFEMEREGRAYLFVPEVMPVRNGERSVARLAAAHELGLAQVRREMPAIRAFLGV